MQDDGSDDNEEESKKEGSDAKLNVSVSMTSEAAAQKDMYQRIVQKLVEYNDKINTGKEISVMEYLKRIDSKSAFM